MLNSLTPRRAALLIFAAALATTRLRVGSLVFSNDFRHPVLVAQIVAQRNGLRQRLVKPQHLRDRAGDLRDLERVRRVRRT